jgi:hypothetical protein
MVDFRCRGVRCRDYLFNASSRTVLTRIERKLAMRGKFFVHHFGDK